MGLKRKAGGSPEPQGHPYQSSVDSHEATTTCPSHQLQTPWGGEPACFIPPTPTPDTRLPATVLLHKIC